MTPEVREAAGNLTGDGCEGSKRGMDVSAFCLGEESKRQSTLVMGTLFFDSTGDGDLKGD